MSLCGVCYSEIQDGELMDVEHLSYDGCEGPFKNEENYYENR